MAMIEYGMLRRPARFLVFFALAAAALIALARYRSRLLESFTFVFEEQPERDVLTLNLSQ
jgi:hypothetical protein